MKRKTNRKKQEKDEMLTFSKRAVRVLLIVGAINGTLPFVLSYLDKDPVIKIGIAWITEIVAVILGYLLKSYKENKQKGIQHHADMVAGLLSDDDLECEDDEDFTEVSDAEETNDVSEEEV